MTILVGVLTATGVVLGADSSATFATASGLAGLRTVEQPCKKITLVDDQVAVACSGEVGLGQRFVRQVSDQWRAWTAAKAELPHEQDMAREITRRVISDFQFTGVPLPGILPFPGPEPLPRVSALVAFPRQGQVHLVEFVFGGLQPEFKTLDGLWFSSMGSGQTIVDPFLAFLRSVFWAEGPPNLSSATLACVWALDHAVDVNPGGIKEPIRVAVVKAAPGRRQASFLGTKDLQEQKQQIAAIKEAMRRAQATSGALPEEPGEPPPPAPPPPAPPGPVGML